jgi:hypothetical protein
MLLEYEKAIFLYLRKSIPDLQRLMYADEEDLFYIRGDLSLNSCYYTRNLEDWPLPKLMRIQADTTDPIQGDVRVVDYYLRTIDYTAIFVVEREQEAQQLANQLRFFFTDEPYVIAHYDLGEELAPLEHQEFKIQFTGARVETVRNHRDDKGAWRKVEITWRSWVPMRRTPINTVLVYRGFILAVNGTVFMIRPETVVPEGKKYFVSYLSRICQKHSVEYFHLVGGDSGDRVLTIDNKWVTMYWYFIHNTYKDDTREELLATRRFDLAVEEDYIHWETLTSTEVIAIEHIRIQEALDKINFTSYPTLPDVGYFLCIIERIEGEPIIWHDEFTDYNLKINTPGSNTGFSYPTEIEIDGSDGMADVLNVYDKYEGPGDLTPEIYGKLLPDQVEEIIGTILNTYKTTHKGEYTVTGTIVMEDSSLCPI